MDYGLYLTASGLMTNIHRQDTVANNIANANTVGFKQDLMHFQARDPEVIEDQLNFQTSLPLLNKLGGGVFVHPSMKAFQQGSLLETGNDLDIAIEGEGFLAVQKPNAEGNPEVQLSRDGRLTVRSDNTLIQVGTNLPVLDVDDQPIEVNPNEGLIRIERNGVITQNGEEIARLQISVVDDPQRLAERGQGLYALTGDPVQQRNPAPTSTMLHQGFLEASNVDAVRETVNMIEASRAISMQGNLMRMQQSILEQAVSRLPRVSG